jgi:DNA-binding LacI/PurR family transcriptional regulator
MKLLEKEGYVQAQNGVGYFVCYVSPDIVTTRKVVNFITGLTVTDGRWQIIEQGKTLFENAGWEVRLMTIPGGDLSSCVPQINSPDAYSVLFFTRINWENFTATFGHVARRVVVIGQLSGNADVCSIISDEYETIRRCIEYFRSRNRFKTAIINAVTGKELDMLRTAAWRSIMTSHGCTLDLLNDLCCNIEDEFLNDDRNLIRQKYTSWLRINKKKIDSVIISWSPDCFLEACQDTAVKVPEDIAVLAIARSSKVGNSDIPILDHNLFGHFQCALEILEERFKTGRKTPAAWHFIPPGKIC